MIRRELVYAVLIGWVIGMVAHSTGPPSLRGMAAAVLIAAAAAASWYHLDRWLTARKNR